jgi:hypothetical protein
LNGIFTYFDILYYIIWSVDIHDSNWPYFECWDTHGWILSSGGKLVPPKHKRDSNVGCAISLLQQGEDIFVAFLATVEVEVVKSQPWRQRFCNRCCEGRGSAITVMNLKSCCEDGASASWFLLKEQVRIDSSWLRYGATNFYPARCFSSLFALCTFPTRHARAKRRLDHF